MKYFRREHLVAKSDLDKIRQIILDEVCALTGMDYQRRHLYMNHHMMKNLFFSLRSMVSLSQRVEQEFDLKIGEVQDIFRRGSVYDPDQTVKNYMQNIADLIKRRRHKHVVTKSDLDAMRKMIADGFKQPMTNIAAKAHVINDLGGDSLDTYNLLYNMEEEFGISIPDYEILKSLNDNNYQTKGIYRLVAKHMKERER